MKQIRPHAVFITAILGCLYCLTEQKPAAELATQPPAEIAPLFRPPPEYRSEFGGFRSPLIFADGTRVATAADWQRRRQEILSTWHRIMGSWPALIENPRVDIVQSTWRENITQQHVRIEIALGNEMVDALLLVPDNPFNEKRPAVVVTYYDAETGAGLGAPLRDYGWQLARRGFVTLSIGKPNARVDLTTTNKPRTEPYLGPVGKPIRVEPLSALAYAAANAHTVLAQRNDVAPDRIGIVGHSFGGKWAMFASCLYDKFAAAAWSDPGIVFDERDRRKQNPSGSVNYWDVWYLGAELGTLADPKSAGPFRPSPSEGQPRTGAYKALIEGGHDLTELHALMAPRPFLVSGGTADLPERWPALNHAIAVNQLLGFDQRVALSAREGHTPTAEANEQIYRFFEWSLGDSSYAKVLHRTVDLNVGEEQEVQLLDGELARVQLVNLRETRDDVNGAVRRAEVEVKVNGQVAHLVSGNYQLPLTSAGVQIDCPITKGYLEKSGGQNPWGLLKDARLRLWPPGSPWLAPNTFVYPSRQRWFANYTQMANEPVYVDGGDLPAKKEIYYHFGLDMGGAEGLIDVVSATDGIVTSSGNDVLPGQAPDAPAEPRYDNVYIRDARGWYCRYSHLKFIDPAVRPGARVRMGQKLGVIGKEGGSGGWSHLHFDIWARQPSGLWGIEEGYAFLWEAYAQEHPRELVAVARPHALLWAGQKVTLDGSRSRGQDLQFEWSFTDGGTAPGPKVERVYDKPGTYCETLKVSDAAGQVDYDFMAVQVIDRAHPENPPPTIHAAYAPTFGIRPGDPVIFKVRTFRDKVGGETWDFGDGTPRVTVKSDANERHSPTGYAETSHSYEKAGRYLVQVEHVRADGVRAMARLLVRVGTE